MLRRLDAVDHDSAMAFLCQQPDANLFMIGDIENYGYDNLFQDVWGSFDADDQLLGILLRYHENILISAPNHAPREEFQPLLLLYSRMTLAGIPQALQTLLDFDQLPKLKTRIFHFARLRSIESLHPCHEGYAIRRAEVSDAAGMAQLQGMITEFEEKPSADQIVHRLQTSGRAYLYAEGERILSCASTTAENSRSAMIVGVMTHPEARGHGFAGACVSKLCAELLDHGKSACLFYDNPAAGSIYRRIGFEEFAQWWRISNFI